MSTAGSKKLINDVDACVDECLDGLVAVNPGLKKLAGHRVIVRSDIDSVIRKGQVGLLSGGGSGHEPAHAGYIGEGMLSTAVAGAVFTSPPPNSIQAAVRAVGKNNPGGVLMIVKNYTGDRLNFGLAAERAKAEGISVDMVVVAEDCALTSTDKTAGRRGLCGTVLIHKIAGALAEEGKTLSEIVTIARDAATKNGWTIGLCLSPCSVPGSGPSFHIQDDEMELGLGIHGEAGVKRTKLVSAKEAVKMMLDHMTNPKTTTHLSLSAGDRVACMVNNLGGTSVLELNIVAREAVCYLEGRGLKVDRMYCGTFMTSLQMAGVSITLLKLDDTLCRCLDAPTSAPGWSKPYLPRGVTDRQTPGQMTIDDSSTDTVVSGDESVSLSQEDGARLYNVLSAVSLSLVAAEGRLNSLDREAGDGDCGTTVSRGAKAILSKLGTKDNPGLPVRNPSSLALSLANIVETDMGGSSGALYSLFLTAAAKCLKTSAGAAAWSTALHQGIQAVTRYGGAEPGDRTMLDALYPASSTLEKQLPQLPPLEAFAKAVEAAQQGADATAGMKAGAGRASYVGAVKLNQPDPGAVAVTIWMKAALASLTS
ncbi:LOW QUALITY PROTEIN: triokinase/FMN cyclase-like [Haliotis rubra]|uniref:LOW QUALITY PROTEIN: triokinase/FMN cyclase-like n=1 Tax=Haliotis rubra TaxID=36100 RepID=UPI001EE5FBDB|nr:LOW QUALITY PROTEIN: triokinase/FMN cyclase-like [Haliotis rubra]